ncbi:MAG: uracil-DNA glycosylase [Minisyncoccota bacterium]
MQKEQAIRVLHATMMRTCHCTLRNSALRAVPGTGNVNGKLMFIGEAPGKKEDESGRPFVGSAGKVLDTLLASIHLTREEVYITNIVKYRPPNNRDPNLEEVNACQEWLAEEIRIIQPKIIVTLGRYALANFIAHQKISEAHGQVFQHIIPNIGLQTFLVLYHPAVALYNKRLYTTLLLDFQKILPLLDKK